MIEGKRRQEGITMLLTDFDASRQAVINPDMLFSPVPDLPETAVSCFSHVTFERMLDMAADVRVLASSATRTRNTPFTAVCGRGRR